MINDRLNGELNQQINAEIYSAYLYLSMCAWFESKNLSGFATWMKAQFQEEMFHADKMFNYLNERGGSVILETIDKPKAEWDSPIDVFEDVAQHEAHVTGLINELVNSAIEEKDHALNNFLQWFVAEQVEEEASVGGVLEKLKMIGDHSAGLFTMDMELGKRVFSPDPE